MLKRSILMISMLSTQLAFAELNIPGISTQSLNTLAAQDQTLAKTGLNVNEDDLTSEQDINKMCLSDDSGLQIKNI